MLEVFAKCKHASNAVHGSVTYRYITSSKAEIWSNLILQRKIQLHRSDSETGHGQT